MLTEDGLALILSRIEAKAVQSSDNRGLYMAEKRKVDDLERRLRQANYTIGQKVADLKAAEDKIAEWLSHSESLSRLVSKGRRKEIPPLPKPFETEIPF